MITIDSQIWIYYWDINAPEHNNVKFLLNGKKKDGILFKEAIACDNTCDNTLIKTNVLVSEDLLFIEDVGTNTKLEYNYFGMIPPCFIIEIISQSFSKTEFIVIVNISSECVGLRLAALSIQVWWNGTILPKSSIVNLGNGVYNVSLTPKFVEPGKDPILLNMTISGAYHRDKYFKMYIAVDPKSVDIGSNPSFVSSSGDDDDDDGGEEPAAIPGFDLWVVFAIITLISLIVVLKKRKIVN